VLRHASPDHPAADRSLSGLVGYAAAWVLAGAVVAVGAILATHETRHQRRTAAPADLPPVREVALASAVRNARCDIHASTSKADTSPPSRASGSRACRSRASSATRRYGAAWS
jgi:hypothetical protein